MPKSLFIRGARQLLTLRGPQHVRRGKDLQQLTIIDDGSLLIRDGVLVQIGSTRRLENLKETRTAAELDADGWIVMPAFVDPSLRLRAAPARKKRRGLLDFHEQSLALMRLLYQHGTLNIRVQPYADAIDSQSQLSMLAQLARIGDHPIGMVRSWKLQADAGQELTGKSTFETIKRRKLAHTVEVNPAQWKAGIAESIRASADSSGLSVHLEWPGSEILAEPANDLPASLRILRPAAVSSSATLTREERAALAASAVPVIFSTRHCLGQENFTPAVREFAEEGGAIALSTGYDSGESPAISMQMSIALAVTRMGLSPEQAIVASTVNSAYAIGLGGRVGTLEVGKSADLLVLTLPDYRELPRRYGINHVGVVIREGTIVFNRTGRKVSTFERTPY